VSEAEYRMTDTHKSDALPPVLTLDDVGTVAPALERYTQGVLLAISGNALIYRRAIAASLPWWF
jgi:hypothetical protein